MELSPKNYKRPLLLLAGLSCLLAISACVTTTAPHATTEAPFVISFEFIKPFTLPARQIGIFERALDKYAVKGLSKVRENGHIIWPLGNMKTVRMMSAGAPPAEGPVGDHPTKTDNQTADSGKWDMTRPTKTDVVAFASAQDLRNFINCIQGNGCP